MCGRGRQSGKGKNILIAKYLAEWKKPVQTRVEYRTVEKLVPVEKVHTTCLQCMHGTRDQGQPGRVYCRRFGYQMMPQAYCSMAELNTERAVRDKVQEAERQIDKADKALEAYRDYLERYRAIKEYQAIYEAELQHEKCNQMLYDLQRQVDRMNGRLWWTK